MPKKKRKCQYISQEKERCQKEGNKCVGTFYDEGKTEESIEYYCFDHMALHGYCTCCFTGWYSGMESFDFLHPGLCDYCYDELRAEEYDNYFDSEDYEDWY